MTNTKLTLALSVVILSGSGCNVESTGTDTGGVGGQQPHDEACPDGVAVVLSDYLSTQIALSDLTGKTKSASLISTASASTDGLAFALSGDVVLPSAPGPSGELTLIDRYGTNVITWVSLQSGEVRAQLSVGTGFESNPQDLITVSDNLAFVSRWGQNAKPGAEPFDSGGDVLVIDPSVPEIIDSIEMPTAADYPARPGPMLRLGDELVVTLGRTALDYSTAGETMFIGLSISERRITWEQTLTGQKACGRPQLSPDGKLLAIACTGHIMLDGSIEDLGQSALLVFDAIDRPLRERARFSAEGVAGEALQNSVTFATNNLVLLKTQTTYGGGTHNRWISFNIQTEETSTLITAAPDRDGNGKGLVYGGMSCSPGCSDICLLADSDAGVLQRARVESGDGLTIVAPRTVEDSVGLPPVGLAVF